MMERESNIGLSDEQTKSMYRKEVTTIVYRCIPCILGVLADEVIREQAELLDIIQDQCGGEGLFAYRVKRELTHQSLVEDVGTISITKHKQGTRYYRLTEHGIKEAWRFADEKSRIIIDGRRVIK